jgi:hypothetical protein
LGSPDTQLQWLARLCNSRTKGKKKLFENLQPRTPEAPTENFAASHAMRRLPFVYIPAPIMFGRVSASALHMRVKVLPNGPHQYHVFGALAVVVGTP